MAERLVMLGAKELAVTVDGPAAERPAACVEDAGAVLIRRAREVLVALAGSMRTERAPRL
jgi:hypothetical protein